MATLATASIDRPRYIPSLDGLRALSIILVMVTHTLFAWHIAIHVPLWKRLLGNGEYGVLIFFVISGYLITTLLLRERARTGTISLPSFYLRRAFRILPPFYIYVFFIGALGAFGRIPGMNRRDLLTALTFTHNYLPNNNVWAFEHLWSLCVEEQFYLLWPPLLVLYTLHRRGSAGRHRATWIALAVIATEPFLRVLSFRYLPHFHNAGAFHMSADGLMFGALGALQQGHHRFEKLYSLATRWPWILPLLLFFANGFLSVRFGRYWDLPIGLSIAGFLILMWLLWLVRNPLSLQGRFLNLPLSRWIGRLSYSLYIWQTFFLHHLSAQALGSSGWYNTFPTNWLCILLVATVSFYCIEQPSLRLRDIVLRRMHWHET